MNSEIYQEVKEIVIDLVNASSCDDTQAKWSHYQQLKKICLDYENGESNHPFQCGLRGRDYLILRK